MNEIPVILVCYNRPYHTSQVLSALKENNIQNLYVFADAPRTEKDVKSVLETRKLIEEIDWTTPRVTYQIENQGLAKSITTAANTVFKEYDRLILLEDDCVPQKYFFDFMHTCLNKYENNDKVYGITGYSVPVPQGVLQGYPYDLYFFPRIGSWGWATWKSKWQHKIDDLQFLKDEILKRGIDINQGGNDVPGMLNALLNGTLKDVWSISWLLSVYLKGGFYIYPTASHIINVGLDGTGVHCGATERFDTITATSKPLRFPDHILFDELITENFYEKHEHPGKNEKSVKIVQENKPGKLSAIDVYKSIGSILDTVNSENKRPNTDKEILIKKANVKPVSRLFGFDRGTPIDRIMIESFLKQNESYITGNVLEIGDNSYTRLFGKNIIKSDILNYVESETATIVGDLSTGVNIPKGKYDCFILTQTLNFVYDFKTALKNAYLSLKNDGVLLITAGGISQISRYDMDRWGDYWRFTTKSFEMMASELFPEAECKIESRGNVYLAKSFLDGLAFSDIDSEAFNYNDADYQMIVTAVIKKKGSKKNTGKVAGKKSSESKAEASVLLYHRVAEDPIDSQLLAVTPQNFNEQILFIKENYNVIPLYELVENISANTIKENTIAVTFDDGYLDNLTNALPILEKHKVHATIFVSPGLIGSADEFWWDKLERIIFDHKELPSSLSISGDTVNYFWPLSEPGDRIKAFYDLNKICMNMKRMDRDNFISGLYNWAGVKGEGRLSHRLLNETELKRLSASKYIEVGAHTISHSRLSLLSAQEQTDEITQSKTVLEKIIDKKIKLFSYPFGTKNDFNTSTIEILKSSGYTAGIANYPGTVNSSTDKYMIPRLLVRNWDGKQFNAWYNSEDKSDFENDLLRQRDKRFTEILNVHYRK
jgi:peptidoglycan/xylan/chitin deacetylase (PgdA/CDA1 family)